MVFRVNSPGRPRDGGGREARKGRQPDRTRRKSRSDNKWKKRMEDGGRIELAKRALALIGILVWDPLRLKKN